MGCDFFINAHRRPNKWVRIKRKKAHIAQQGALSIVCTDSTCCTRSPGWIRKTQVNPEHAVNLCHSWGIPSLRTEISSKTTWPLSQRKETLLLSCWTLKKQKNEYLPSDLEGDTIFIFQKYSLYQLSRKCSL